jgi:uncharacterized membrane protein
MREVMLILHFIGLAMGLGTSFAHAFLGSVTAKMSADEANRFRVHSLVLGKMGFVGIILLLVSGFYLITPYWKILPHTPLLILKLVLVVILISLITVINILSAKAKKASDPEVQFKKIEPFGKMTMLVALIIVIVAVYIFH